MGRGKRVLGEQNVLPSSEKCKLLDGRGCKVCEMMMCVNCCAQDVVGIPIRSSILVLKLS